jgi:hypothetical protein
MCSARAKSTLKINLRKKLFPQGARSHIYLAYLEISGNVYLVTIFQEPAIYKKTS